ncbi:MAG: DNA-binding response regulator [Synergistaceae bacterium]|jgi:DNA-binding response OmpR family regulator|nr:DNA-binding response regulator [Synergistaceae bacterium]
MFESGGPRDGKIPGYRILVIDDDAGLLQMIRAQLAGHYEVSLAESGIRALHLIEEGLFPDLVLLDIDMPDMNGYETLERLRGNPETEDIPVIFLTGLDDVRNQVKGLGSGVMDYITKPFVKDIMFARLRLHLEFGMERRRIRAARKNGEIVELDEDKFNRLTEALDIREKQIAKLIALGKRNQDIASELAYSLDSVKKLATRIFNKTGLSDRYELRKACVRE